MKQFKLNITSRTEIGSGPSGRLRKAGRIPANVYGKGKARSISVSAVEFRLLNKSTQGSAALIELHDEDGKTVLSTIQNAERNAIKDGYDHIDFHEVERGEAFTTHVPVIVVGEEKSIGVKNESGLIDQHVYELEIRCKPGDLPESIELDVSGLHVGEGIHLGEVKVPEGVEIHGESDLLLVGCVGSRISRTSAEKADDAEADAEAAAEVESAEKAEA